MIKTLLKNIANGLECFGFLKEACLIDGILLKVAQGSPELVIMVGIPGSGKSTYVQKYREMGYEVINPDSIRVELTGDMADQSRNHEAWLLTHQLLVYLLKIGQNAVLDATNVNLSNRRKFMKAIKEEVPNVRFKAVVVNVDKEEAVRRVKKRVEEGGLDIPEDVMDRMYNNLRINPPSEEEGFESIEII